MSTKDIVTTNKYKAYPPKVGAADKPMIVQRRITGAELNAAGTPASDTFKIMQIRNKSTVMEVLTKVVDADANGITMDIGYIDDNGASATAFEGNAALNTTGNTLSADDIITFSSDGFITITLDGAIEDATTFVVEVVVWDEAITLRDDTISAAF